MIKIVTDSTAYPTEEEISSMNLTIVPLYVTSNKGIYKERVDISDEEFYKRLKEGEEFSRSQPSTNDFVEAYKPLIEQGYEIVSIHISSILSGTVNAANAAKESLGTDRITVIDSKSSSVDLLYKVIKAYELIQKGATRDEIKNEIEKMHPRVHGFFLPMNIDLLIKGGRISHLQGKITTALKLYFILYLNEGRIDLYKFGRTRNGSKEELIKIVKDISQKRGGLERIDTVFSANDEEGEEFRQRVEKEFGSLINKYRIGPVLGTHLGLESLGIAFITKE
jgi:DegV family protein with EDD domain|uniref:DegV family protein n=1 Tax=Caldisericum exile TaxID=693075 RepID=A0A7C4TVR5_9BACT